MTRIALIGATGHVGTYLVPRLVGAGHEVAAISRGRAEPYRPSQTWEAVERVVLDREALEADGGFGAAILGLRPDVVVDMICFTPESARQLAGALEGRVSHLVHVGTVWTHGHSAVVPTPEHAPKRPFGAYGTAKAEIEALLLRRSRMTSGLPVTVIHPGHITGPGWRCINPAGNLNPEVFGALARGERLALPNFGLETVHHVHADDVAALIVAAIDGWGASVGESFHAVSEGALTLRGFAESVAGWFGRPAELVFQPFETWRAGQSTEDAQATWEHIARSPNCSMEKARRRLGFRPRHSSLEAVREAVEAMVAKGEIRL
jgi:nucleoside-diphosphate-sugar epimerase